MSTQHDASEILLNAPGFRSSPVGYVYGIVDGPEDDVPAVVSDLLRSSLSHDGIHIYCCPVGADAIDLTGSRRCLRARITRALQTVAYEPGHLDHIEAELLAGHALVGVEVGDDARNEVAAIMTRHGAHHIAYYGPYSWMWLGPSALIASEPENESGRGVLR